MTATVIATGEHQVERDEVKLPSVAIPEAVGAVAGDLHRRTAASRLAAARPLHQLAFTDVARLRDRVMRATGTLRDDAALGAIPDDEIADWESFVQLVEGDTGGVGSARSQLGRTSVLHLALEHAGEIQATNIRSLPVVLWMCAANSYRDVLWF